ncbi:MAG: CYTH domain-containing protein [Chloroflexi bacterium]|nr:MAG: CYTH domain-containing protein [Chloroflexota bacterium]TME39270.1 MAG: CYTH domain-containing protein [Chloroflexota bacterium]TME55211.1 MAG: CYTH domain-containing protein [Chloroflexota bacterium]
MAGRRLRVPRDRSIESELKFRVRSTRDHTKLRNLLRKRGGKLIGRYKEDNYRFNGPGKSTRKITLRLRILNGGPRGVLTAKGPATFEGGVKIREETEVEVPDVHATLDMLQQLGFRVGWTYPKQRTMWMLDGVAVTLDVLDFGWFVELEGPAQVLPEMARSLGLDPAKALKDSYSVMARKHLKAKKPTKAPPTPVVIPPAAGTEGLR